MNSEGKKKVFVGVSGGVDSSVAAALLLEQEYDVTGVFLKVWHPDFLPCDWKEERRSAMRVCATLGIPFMTLDCEAEYKKEVADYMIDEYRNGCTPNPDIFCNKYVKFGVFLRKARELGADFVATGHYAQVECTGGVYTLHEAADKEKDQSYFLYTLGQDELSQTLFPIGHMKKSEVRARAASFGLHTATKKDSQGLCFLGMIDMKDFLSHYIEEKPGDVLNIAGEIIGRHTGALFYTIGERHHFTITKKTATDPRYFVVAKDIERNTITVADKEHHPSTIASTQAVTLRALHASATPISAVPLLTARIRYRQDKQACSVEMRGDVPVIHFDTPQSAVAPGQSVVLYSGEVCVGGGIIELIHSA